MQTLAAAYLAEHSHYYVRAVGLDQPLAVSSQNQALIGAHDQTARPVWLNRPSNAVVLLGWG